MNDNWFVVYGMAGVKYMKDGKYYDVHKRLLEFDENGKPITTQPPPVKEEPAEVPELELVDRVKIKSPADPNFLKKSDIQRALLDAGVKPTVQASREELLNSLKNHLGLSEE